MSNTETFLNLSTDDSRQIMNSADTEQTDLREDFDQGLYCLQYCLQLLEVSFCGRISHSSNLNYVLECPTFRKILN